MATTNSLMGDNHPAAQPTSGFLRKLVSAFMTASTATATPIQTETASIDEEDIDMEKEADLIVQSVLQAEREMGVTNEMMSGVDIIKSENNNSKADKKSDNKEKAGRKRPSVSEADVMPEMRELAKIVAKIRYKLGPNVKISSVGIDVLQKRIYASSSPELRAFWDRVSRNMSFRKAGWRGFIPVRQRVAFGNLLEKFRLDLVEADQNESCSTQGSALHSDEDDSNADDLIEQATVAISSRTRQDHRMANHSDSSLSSDVMSAAIACTEKPSSNNATVLSRDMYAIGEKVLSDVRDEVESVAKQSSKKQSARLNELRPEIKELAEITARCLQKMHPSSKIPRQLLSHEVMTSGSPKLRQIWIDNSKSVRFIRSGYSMIILFKELAPFRIYRQKVFDELMRLQLTEKAATKGDDRRGEAKLSSSLDPCIAADVLPQELRVLARFVAQSMAPSEKTEVCHQTLNDMMQASKYTFECTSSGILLPRGYEKEFQLLRDQILLSDFGNSKPGHLPAIIAPSPSLNLKPAPAPAGFFPAKVTPPTQKRGGKRSTAVYGSSTTKATFPQRGSRKVQPFSPLKNAPAVQSEQVAAQSSDPVAVPLEPKCTTVPASPTERQSLQRNRSKVENHDGNLSPLKSPAPTRKRKQGKGSVNGGSPVVLSKRLKSESEDNSETQIKEGVAALTVGLPESVPSSNLDSSFVPKTVSTLKHRLEIFFKWRFKRIESAHTIFLDELKDWMEEGGGRDAVVHHAKQNMTFVRTDQLGTLKAFRRSCSCFQLEDSSVEIFFEQVIANWEKCLDETAKAVDTFENQEGESTKFGTFQKEQRDRWEVFFKSEKSFVESQLLKLG